jgi:hypothetical protein
MDALALDRDGLADDMADLVRRRRLVDQSVGLRSAIGSNGVTVTPVGPHANASPLASVGVDGGVFTTIDVAVSDQLGFSRVDPERLAAGIRASVGFALDVWGVVDEREEVQRVAVVAAIPDAQYKVFGAATNSKTLQMGSGLPSTVVVPSPAMIVRRGELSRDRLAARLLAEVKRVFVDARAIT